MQPLEISKKQSSLPSLETLVLPKAPQIPQNTIMDTFVSSSTTKQGTSASSLKNLTDAINVSLAMLASPQSFILSPSNSQKLNLSSQVSTSAPITVSSLLHVDTEICILFTNTFNLETSNFYFINIFNNVIVTNIFCIKC